MAISAELLKDAPSWASEYETPSSDTHGWFERRLERRSLVGVFDEADPDESGDPVTLTPMISNELDGTAFVLITELGLKFRDQFALRSLAFALNAAADEVEAIMGGAKWDA